MSLLQGILKAKSNAPSNDERDSDSDNDVVGVVSLPGTPGSTRPSSPTRFSASSKPIRGPLHLPAKSKTDPLRKLPTEISQKIFAHLPVSTLAKCALVSRKWSKSQTLNYVWFQHYRKENFHDESLPPGKWTRRESKQNWRTTYLKTLKDKDPLATAYSRPYTTSSGYASPSYSSQLQSGQQTPRERREEAWSQEAAAAAKPNKVEMREMYKELGGRKSKAKTKLGADTGFARDKGGWDNGGEGW